MRHLIKTARLAMTFYRSFVFAPLLITIFAISCFLSYGFRVFAAILWLKILTNAVIWYQVREFKKKELYYYRNLGVSEKKLWVIVFVFDFSVLVAGIFIAKQFL
ncbi:hypothetical protein [Filimonas effusa]|uniref:Uncharacterized protein n=1 Tax=Filimonas effusa TaxID=2508721 RepID=A0A4Q1DDL4_9BACT|nr:hypothetical protein [Filimonas effusa]RXK86753.1 hypothetical protein ESB13_08110 [Filimonas effusa]